MHRNLPRPTLVALWTADQPGSWKALGFTVEDQRVDLGGIRITLGAPGQGISSWAIAGIGPTDDIDGLSTTQGSPPPKPITHPNGATGIDHVVITTPDFDRTAAALSKAGMELRRVRDAGSFRQGFRRLGPAILELVERPNAPPGPATFWGLVVIVSDLDALAERLGNDLGSITEAVQPGRQIATLRPSAGLTEAVAFMDPET
jgi:hypothetical protein